MTRPLHLHPHRLFPPDPRTRDIAAALHAEIAGLPIVSPHGHTDPAWWATDAPFANAAELLLVPDHYLLRMLYSRGVRLEELGVPRLGGRRHFDPRAAWRKLAENYHLFRGTPSRIWLDWVFAETFGIEVVLDGETADLYFDTINERMASDAFRKPRRCSRWSGRATPRPPKPNGSARRC